MKTETIRALDSSVGSVLCSLFTLHRRLFGRIGEHGAEEARSHRILFVKLIEQGATVLAYDAIRKASDRVGPENVFFCVFEENREIVDLLGLIPVENVIVIRSGTLIPLLRDVWRAVRRVRRLRIDTTIDMEFLSRTSAILAYLMGARRRVGLHRFSEEAPYRGDLMTHRVLYNPFLHTARAYSLLIDALDADPGDVPLVKVPIGPLPKSPPAFVPQEAEVQRLRALLDEAAGGQVDRPIVLLNPSCGDLLPLRRWPVERFAELGRRILTDHASATLVITGTPSERAGARALCRSIDSPRAVNMAGRTSVRELLVLCDLADLMVTNDSGPGHFATLTSIDTIVLFGPAAPSQFGPLGDRSQALWAGLACSPCANVYNHRFSACNNNVCMQAISVDQVHERVRACLAGQRRGAAPTLEEGA